MCFLTGLRIYSFTHSYSNGINDPNDLNSLNGLNGLNDLNVPNEINPSAPLRAMSLPNGQTNDNIITEKCS
jgi:hypothetical protein